MIAILLSDIVHNMGVMLTFCLLLFGDWRNPLSQNRQNLQRFRFGDRGQITLYSEAASDARLTGANSTGVGEGGE